MRLLNTSTFQFRKFKDPGKKYRDTREKTAYAIVSHRWLDEDIYGEEITLQTLNPANILNTNLQSLPLNKIRGACARAREQKLEWIWMDTCCIDRTNNVELTESLNSMYSWYQTAVVCYTHLSDVVWSARSQQMFNRLDENGNKTKLESEWFERGWTLQELLGSVRMEFVDKDWRYMGQKNELTSILQRITRIEEKYLIGKVPVQRASVATRMSWMAGRATTKVEDIAYSMLGIFEVSMDVRYGEGRKEFMRFQSILMSSTATASDESIYAWTVPGGGLKCFDIEGWRTTEWGILAPSPDCFKDSFDINVTAREAVPRPLPSYSPEGVVFYMPQKSGTEATNWAGLPRSNVNLALNCWRGDAAVVLHLRKTNNGYERTQCNTLDVTRGAKPDTNRVFGIDQLLRRALLVNHKFVKQYGDY